MTSESSGGGCGGGASGDQRVVNRRAAAFDSRVLCLHYYSDALGLDFGDSGDVYPIAQIQEFAASESDPLWLAEQLAQMPTGFLSWHHPL